MPEEWFIDCSKADMVVNFTKYKLRTDCADM